jgi:hypothetical protein
MALPPTSESARRYAICKACPELLKLFRTCRACGCFMPGKVKLPQAKCPRGNW